MEKIKKYTGIGILSLAAFFYSTHCYNNFYNKRKIEERLKKLEEKNSEHLMQIKPIISQYTLIEERLKNLEEENNAEYQKIKKISDMVKDYLNQLCSSISKIEKRNIKLDQQMDSFLKGYRCHINSLEYRIFNPELKNSDLSIAEPKTESQNTEEKLESVFEPIEN